MGAKSCKTVRRSVALSCDLIDEVRSVAPPELAGNFNRLMSVALSEFARRRRRENTEKAMADMAQDPGVRKDCSEISEEFIESEADGLEP